MAWGVRAELDDQQGVIPRPLADDGSQAEYPMVAGRQYLQGRRVKWGGGVDAQGLACLDLLRDGSGRLHMVRRWAPTRTRAVEEAEAAVHTAMASEAAARAESEATDNAVAIGDLSTTVGDLVDDVMAHHAPSLSIRTQEEYGRIRRQMDDDDLPAMMGELPRAVDAGVARAWIEGFVRLHGPSSAVRASRSPGASTAPSSPSGCTLRSIRFARFQVPSISRRPVGSPP